MYQSDAIGPKYKYDMNQRLVLESKADMRKRGVRSPDLWDAVALTFAEPVYVKREDERRRRQTSVVSQLSEGWMV
jgi:hypothetical protein